MGRRGAQAAAGGARPRGTRVPGALRRLLPRRARSWTSAATASAVVAPLVLVAVLAEGHAVHELTQSAAAVWVASPRQGLVSLVDGPSDAVAAALRVPAAAELEVAQAGASAYLVDEAAGTVRRVDGATFELGVPVAFGTPGGSLDVLLGVDDVYVLDATRRTATVVDPRTLGTVAELPLAAQPGAGQSVVDDRGRLWVVDGAGGGLTWFDGTHHVDRDAADADDRLVLVRGRPVLVDVAGGSVAPLGDAGRPGRRTCLEARAGDTTRLLGSADRDEVYAAVGETGTLVVAAVGRDDCSRVVPVADPGAPTDFGPLAQSGRFVFVPDQLTGQVVVVDLRTDEVAGRFDLTPAGNRLELLADDGLVFYNDLDGHEVGVLRFDGREWVAGPALTKYDPSDGEPVAAVPDPATPDTPVAPGPDPGPTGEGPTPTAAPTAPPPGAPDPSAPRPAPPATAAPGRPGPGPTVTGPTASATPVTVQVDVVGGGRVTSSPPGLDCPGTCVAPFAPGTSVTLTAAPASGAEQLGWSGACRDVAVGSPCVVTVQGPVTTGAEFGVPPGRVSVVVNVVGRGAVESDPPGLTCDRASSPCTADFPDDVPVLLTAVADPDAAGGTWSGDCGDRHCELPAGAGGDVTATFVTPRLLQVTAPTYGRVTGPGVSCPGDCVEWVDQEEVVTLTAVPDEDGLFAAWSQDCTGASPTCEMTVDEDPAVGATFDAYPIGLFVGTWDDVASDSTMQVVATALTASSGSFAYWGDCTPTGCSWGSRDATVVAGQVSLLYDGLSAADRYVTLSRDGAVLRASVVSDYYDDRATRVDVYLFTRAG